MRNFNSIKVQLKRRIALQEVLVELEFQFHKGTIKTEDWQGEAHSRLHFNSIKVQLKLGLRKRKKRVVLFQFHKGTIKTFTSTIPPKPLQISIP